MEKLISNQNSNQNSKISLNKNLENSYSNFSKSFNVDELSHNSHDNENNFEDSNKVKKISKTLGNERLSTINNHISKMSLCRDSNLVNFEDYQINSKEKLKRNSILNNKENKG